MVLRELKSPKISSIHFLGVEGKEMQIFLKDGLLLTCSGHNPEILERSLLPPFKNGEGRALYFSNSNGVYTLIVSSFVWVNKSKRHEETA